MPKYLLIIMLIICSLASSELSMADVSPDQVKEVNHLLAFVKNSGCIINRNGSDHPAEKGVSHIEMKYDYFRDEINSSEEFIEYSASKSTMSGKYYTLTCPCKETIKTKDWLLAELKKYRAK